MTYLEQSTAVTIKLGAFVDAVDGFTPETSLTISQADIRLSKNGGNSAQTNNVTGATHDEFGQYDIPLNETDTDTLGILKVMVYEVGSRPISIEFMVIDSQSYEQLLNGVSVATGTSAISTIAESAVLTTGSETLTYISTHERDLVYHEIEDDAGTTDIYYQFDIGGNGVPSSVTFIGYVFNSNDNINIYGYNFGASSWEQIGNIEGKNQLTDDELTFSLLNTHIGSGANIGKVRVRLENTGLSSSILAIDQLYLSYAVVVQSVGYANGAIWIDTITGEAGTVPFVNGTADNPSDNVVDALSIAITMGLSRFEIAPNSTITLFTDATGLVGIGEQWILELDSQVITNGSVRGANVSGIAGAGSTGTQFIDSHIGTCSLTPFNIRTSGLIGTLTLLETGTYLLSRCYSEVAGTGAPIVDFGLVGAKNLSIREYSGGIDLRNMKAGDTMSLEGNGQLILNANCTGGTIAIRGNFDLTDNSGVVTLSEDARFTKSETVTELVDRVLIEPTDITDKTIGGILWHLFSRLYHKVTQTATTQVVYESDSSTPLGSMTTSDDGTTQTKGKAT